VEGFEMSRAAFNDPDPDILTELYVLRSYARKLTEAVALAQAEEAITDAISQEQFAVRQ
jgi:hypothetical protein